MKKILNGKKYDTETAERLAGGEHPTATGRDFHFYKEELFRTKNGAYFLAGHGGPASKYAEPAVGGGRIGGEDITPLTEEEAYAWAEKHVTPGRAEELFPNHVVEA